MPVVWDETLYQQAYGGRDPDTGARLVYGLRWAQVVEGAKEPTRLSLHERMWGEVVRAMPVSQSDNILIIGCGFGYILHAARLAGYINTWGDDTSPYIHTELANQTPGAITTTRVLDVDVTDPTAAQQFKAAGAGDNKGQFEWIVTFLVVESFNPATELIDFNAFLDGCESLRNNKPGGVLHVFAGLLDPPHDRGHRRELGLTWMKGADWATIRPAHHWLDIHGWQLAGGA